MESQNVYSTMLKNYLESTLGRCQWHAIYICTSYIFVQRKLAGDHPRSSRQKKITPLEERFIQITSRRDKFLTAISLCIMSRNCLWCVSIHQNPLEPSQMHVKDDQNIDMVSF